MLKCNGGQWDFIGGTHSTRDYCCLITPHLQIEKRLEPVEADEGNENKESGETSSKSGCTIFLGYTSNLISSGVRESIRYLAEHKMVHTFVHLTSRTINQ